MKPSNNEPICPISYKLTCILVGGEPEQRPGFWKKYRDNLEHNRKTKYRNSRIEICARQLADLKLNPKETLYYRNDRLVPERDATPQIESRIAD